jgi:hypothetical protein
MLAGEEVPSFPEAARQMEAFVESRRALLSGSPEVVMVAHNGRRFDSQFLKAEYRRAEMEMPKWKYLDTLGLSRSLLGSKDYPRSPPKVSVSLLSHARPPVHLFASRESRGWKRFKRRSHQHRGVRVFLLNNSGHVGGRSTLHSLTHRARTCHQRVYSVRSLTDPTKRFGLYDSFVARRASR